MARTIALARKMHSNLLPAADLEPPGTGELWPEVKPGSFLILVVGKQQPGDETGQRLPKSSQATAG